MRDNKWVRLLAYVTGLVNQRLLSKTNTWRLRTASSARISYGQETRTH
jgi:hypothetical protein